MTLEQVEGSPRPKLRSVELALEVSSNLDKNMYLTKENIPSRDGIKPLLHAFTTGIAATIKIAETYGFDKKELVDRAKEELDKAIDKAGGLEIADYGPGL